MRLLDDSEQVSPPRQSSVAVEPTARCDSVQTIV